ncbi:hypothetical protein ARMGADRAFT_1040938 [Armillaria gallica]|uniref:Uncharacterized protein n=1 Tax=Armillaria gallica TaxID=47427 RepID=A0A2H3CLJ8_ARMGA|nr:hypothetical protein ARMGADRAFT_1040938 [Armillaria gallica]
MDAEKPNHSKIEFRTYPFPLSARVIAKLPKKPSEPSFQERHVHPEMMKGNRGPENHEKSRTPQDKKWTQTEVSSGITCKKESGDFWKKIPIANLGGIHGCCVF